MRQALADQLSPEAIALNVPANTREEVIRLLAAKLEQLGYVRPTYAEAVIAREAKLPTGLPLGREINVAVPHTDPEHVLKPGIALATLARPVDFANMEDPQEAVPVGLVFMLALNHKDRQIEMLQAVMETIQSPEDVDALMAARSAEEALAILRGGAASKGEDR